MRTMCFLALSLWAGAASATPLKNEWIIQDPIRLAPDVDVQIAYLPRTTSRGQALVSYVFHNAGKRSVRIIATRCLARTITHTKVEPPFSVVVPAHTSARKTVYFPSNAGGVGFYGRCSKVRVR